MKKRLPIGIQSFEKLREGGYVYVDKTRFVYDLAHGGGSYFFLARPRRFGKSLLVSTLKAYFEGKRSLFEGLDIMGLERDWNEHPVLLSDGKLVASSLADTDSVGDNWIIS